MFYSVSTRTVYVKMLKKYFKIMFKIRKYSIYFMTLNILIYFDVCMIFRQFYVHLFPKIYESTIKPALTCTSLINHCIL
jgi:hypothetical protein